MKKRTLYLMMIDSDEDDDEDKKDNDNDGDAWMRTRRCISAAMGEETNQEDGISQSNHSSAYSPKR
jgi:hypothetical protein